MLSELPPVTQVRYQAPLDAGVVSPASFSATVDLSRIEPVAGGNPVTVPVTVIALNSRIVIVDYEPKDIQVSLDPVGVRELPVNVALGSVADGLTLGPHQIEPSTVTLRGASSRIDQVSQVIARVSIDASAINVDREIELVAVDGNGNQVSNIEIDPERARVRIAVARELANRTLPIVPVLSGAPAEGYRISAISVEPLVVTVSGEEAIVTRLESAPTQPIDVEGRTTDLEAIIGLDLPDGVSVNGSDQVRIMLTLVQETGSRTFPVSLSFVGTEPGMGYDLGDDSPVVVLEGPLLRLSSIPPNSLLAYVDLSGLPEGTHSVEAQFLAPPGLHLVSLTPDHVVVTVLAASPAP